MPWEAADVVDLVTTTQKDLGRLKFTEIATEIQEHHAVRHILQRKKMASAFQSGVGVQRSIMLDHSAAAKHVKLHAVDDVNIGDVMGTIDIPWRHTTTNHGWEVREFMMNREPARILDLIKVRRLDMMISLAELMEAGFWHTITDDGETPFGVQYWLTYHATTGHNGGNHGSFTSGPGNLSATTYSRWRSGTGNYTNVTKADLIATWRTLFRECNFKPAVDGIPSYDKGGPKYANYCNGTTIQAIEDVGESQNENLGRDIASMDGQMVFRRTPIYWVPYLDAYSTSCPIWMIDWSVFYPVFLKGDYLRQTGPNIAPLQHNTMHVHLDLTWNVLCVNRRKCALIAKADPADGV